jgi:hypothetical protein
MNLDSQWRHRRTARPLVFAGVAAVALAGGAGAGYAATHSTTPAAGSPAAVVAAGSTPAPTPSASGGNGKGSVFPHRGFRFFGGLGFGLGGFGGGVVHGQVTVPKSGGGYQTLDIQDGTVTAVSSTSVTVKSADGFTATYTVTSNTLVNAKSAGIGSVKKGDTVFVSATVTGSTATAAQVIDISAIKSGRAAFGFPFRDGKFHKMPGMPAPQATPPSA